MNNNTFDTDNMTPEVVPETNPKRRLVFILIGIVIVAALALGTFYLINNIPSAIETRAQNAVAALYNEDETFLADGVAENTGKISEAKQLAQKVVDDAVKEELVTKTDTAQLMADTQNGVSGLYTTKDDGSKIVIRNLDSAKISTLDENLSTLETEGKIDFVAAQRQAMEGARHQADLISQINALLDALYIDGSTRQQLKEDATVAALQQATELTTQLENTDTRNDLAFAIQNMQPKVSAMEAQTTAKREAEAEAQRQAEEARQKEEEAQRIADEAEAKRQEAIRILEEQLENLKNQ